MPTFTAIALENLLEPRVRDSQPLKFKISTNNTQPLPPPPPPPPPPSQVVPTNNHIFISPALYITPDPAPIPETSADSLSPSPYVVNHKRRRNTCRTAGDVNSHKRIDGFEVQTELQQNLENMTGDSGSRDDDEAAVDTVANDVSEEEVVQDNFGGGDDGGLAEEEADEDFLDPRSEVFSVGSCCSSDFGTRIRNHVGSLGVASSTHADFFDASDEFSSDGSFSNGPSSGRNLELELRALRLSLLEEIERRKTAEETLSLMHSQWQRISNVLSHAGLRFPAPSNASADMHLQIDAMDQLLQELVVARFVSEAVGRGLARAEAELAAEAIVESKDQEISRLRDRLLYYEAVNHEMSQRNQENKEMARRHRKQSQRRWLWSCIGASVIVGTSLLAYFYLPETSRSRTSSADSSNASVSSPEAG